MRASTNEVKDRVKMIDIMNYYGLKEKNSKYNCPFHGDSNPSLSIKDGMFNCFACDTKGSIFDFVMRMENCEFPAAKDLICERFGIENDNNITEAERLRFAERDKERRAAKEESERLLAVGNYTYRRLCEYLQWLQEQEPPKTPDTLWGKGFIERCHMLDYIGALIDFYMYDIEGLGKYIVDVDSWIKDIRHGFK